MFRRARGFAMGVVIGLLAVLAVLGTAVVVISNTQQVGFGLDLQGVRAYHAARGGIEWGVYHVLRTGYGGCNNINGKSIVYGGNLAGFRATISCSSTPHEEGTTSVNIYDIQATACNDTTCPSVASPPPSSYVARQLRIIISSN